MTQGGRIKKHRKVAGLSQLELAGLTNLSLRTIQRIENDKNTPRGYTIRVLAEALKVDAIALAETNHAEKEGGISKLELINLSVLSFVIIPFGNLIFPVVLWNRFSYFELVDKVGRRVINFQLTWSLITYFLLAISPFVNRYMGISFPLILVVLIASYILNTICVFLTGRQLRKGNYQIYKRAIRFL